MADCIISIVSGKVLVQFDELIAKGVILIFDESKKLHDCIMITNNNSVNFKLPESHSRYSIHIFYDKYEIVKKVAVLNKNKEIRKFKNIKIN